MDAASPSREVPLQTGSHDCPSQSGPVADWLSSFSRHSGDDVPGTMASRLLGYGRQLRERLASGFLKFAKSPRAYTPGYRPNPALESAIRSGQGRASNGLGDVAANFCSTSPELLRSRPRRSRRARCRPNGVDALATAPNASDDRWSHLGSLL